MKRLETLSNVIPVPSPDDEEGDKFWKKVIDDFKRKRGRSIYIWYDMFCVCWFWHYKKCMEPHGEKGHRRLR